MAESREQRALEALSRELAGHELNDQERLDAVWYKRKVCRDNLRETLSDLSKTEYCKLTGLHAATLTQQIGRLRLPIGSRVNLYEVLKRHHEIHQESGIDARGGGKKGVDEEKQLKIEQMQKKNELLDLELRQKKGDFIDRAELALKMERLVGRIVAIGAALGKKFGPDSQKLLNDGLQNIEAEFSDDATD